MMVAQAAASGLVGLPFVSGALTLADKTFPDLEIKKNTKGWINKLMGGDGDNDTILSDMAMMGIPSMLGWDWQSRLSVGNIPGVSRKWLGAGACAARAYICIGQKSFEEFTSGSTRRPICFGCLLFLPLPIS